MRTKYDRLLNEKFGMPIGMMAGQSLAGVHDERDEMVCSECGMMPIGGTCGCGSNVGSCEGCGLSADQCTCDSAGVCPMCGMMPQKIEKACSCGLSEGKKGMCGECGMREAMCQCGGMKEVAPPGHEKMVKGLKKAQAKGDVENAYAVAWHHYKTKHPAGKGKKH